MENGSVFQGIKVLVTGHTGFKGSWLSIWLNMLGAHVIGFALEPYTPKDNFIVTGLENHVTHVIGDIRDFSHLYDAFRIHRPELVFHLAAQPLVRESYTHPKETFDVNIGGTANVLECCRLTDSVRTVINVTSDKCYEVKDSTLGYTESDPLGGHDPYSCSKAASELLTQAYRRSFFTPGRCDGHGKAIATARAGNVIGGGDWGTDRILPDCIRALEKNEPIFLRNPHAVRPWQHVLEPLSGYLLLASKMIETPEKFCEAWNFGPDEKSAITAKKLTEWIIRYWGHGESKNHPNTDAPHEADTLRLNITKSKTLLGWQPLWDIEKAVSATVKWYKQYQKTKNMYRFCEQQIESYMNTRREK